MMQPRESRSNVTDAFDRLKTALSDRYAIERELGSGGMATVYLAEDLKHHRKVAVKVLRPDLAAALGPERFLREIEIAAQLQHPHILPLHDSGEADGFLYYVMPYVRGESLRERLAQHGELPIVDAVKIMREVVDALAHAHEQGVVHRDIKPDNVMLSGRHALVTDFGVAKAVSEATGRAKLTTAGVALGTPSYMAPEQATADPTMDHRADIYAVGALGPFCRCPPRYSWLCLADARHFPVESTEGGRAVGRQGGKSSALPPFGVVDVSGVSLRSVYRPTAFCCTALPPFVALAT